MPTPTCNPTLVPCELLAMPEAAPGDRLPRPRGLRLRRLEGAAPSAREVDPLAGRPYLGALSRGWQVAELRHVQEHTRPTPPAGATGEAAVSLCTWMMGPPPRVA